MLVIPRIFGNRAFNLGTREYEGKKFRLTDASIRKIPIHQSLKPLVEQLVKNADSEGYLIYSSGGNKYGICSDSISKAFGRLKKSLATIIVMFFIAYEKR